MKCVTGEKLCVELVRVLPPEHFPLPFCQLITDYAVSLVCWSIEPRNPYITKLPTKVRLFETDKAAATWECEFEPKTDVWSWLPERDCIITTKLSENVMCNESLITRSFPLVNKDVREMPKDWVVSSLFYSRHLEKLIVNCDLDCDLKQPILTLIDPNTHLASTVTLADVPQGCSIRFRLLDKDERFLAVTAFHKSHQAPTAWTKNAATLCIYDLANINHARNHQHLQHHRNADQSDGKGGDQLRPPGQSDGKGGDQLRPLGQSDGKGGDQLRPPSQSDGKGGDQLGQPGQKSDQKSDQRDGKGGDQLGQPDGRGGGQLVQPGQSNGKRLRCVYGPFDVEGPNRVITTRVWSSVTDRRGCVKLVQVAMITDHRKDWWVIVDISTGKTVSICSNSGHKQDPIISMSPTILFNQECVVVAVVPVRAGRPVAPPILIPLSELQIAETSLGLDAPFATNIIRYAIEKSKQLYAQDSQVVWKTVGLSLYTQFSLVGDDGACRLYRFDYNPDFIQEIAKFNIDDAKNRTRHHLALIHLVH